MKLLLRRPGLWILVLVVLGATAAALINARGPRVTVTSARKQALEQHLSASGRVRVPTGISVASQLPGLVVVVGVEEGQRVQAGELLGRSQREVARTATGQPDFAKGLAAPVG
jgi:multidrug efflux pump subunit AcrA (membrane-fusion protein)